MRGTLHTETLRLLKERRETIIEISQATGIPFYWLRKIEEFENPSVNRIQQLYEYLAGRRLLPCSLHVGQYWCACQPSDDQ